MVCSQLLQRPITHLEFNSLPITTLDDQPLQNHCCVQRENRILVGFTSTRVGLKLMGFFLKTSGFGSWVGWAASIFNSRISACPISKLSALLATFLHGSYSELFKKLKNSFKISVALTVLGLLVKTTYCGLFSSKLKIAWPTKIPWTICFKKHTLFFKKGWWF